MATARKQAPVIDGARLYQVEVDAILGSIEHTEESAPHQYRQLSGEVTHADLLAAGVDIEWQIRIGALTDLGLVRA